jgi:hypothetical protein
MKKALLFALLFALIQSALTSCSVVMAAKQPGKKNLGLIAQGTTRSVVMAELGGPIDSRQKGKNLVEVYKFTQGYSAGVRAGRALFHAAADVFTLALWELAATPIEGIAAGTEMVYEVEYDEDLKVIAVRNLKS